MVHMIPLSTAIQTGLRVGPTEELLGISKGRSLQPGPTPLRTAAHLALLTGLFESRSLLIMLS